MHGLITCQYCQLCDKFLKIRAKENNPVCAELSLTLCSEKKKCRLAVPCPVHWKI